MEHKQTYTITALAQEFGITPRAIRFYEDQGLLSPARAGRTRIYTKADRTRLKLALRGKRLGLSLAEIKELLDMYGGVKNSAAQIEHFLKALSVRRAALEQQRLDIEAMLSEIDMVEQQCKAVLSRDTAAAADARAELARRLDKASVA